MNKNSLDLKKKNNFSNIKSLLSNNITPLMKMIYHYYNICKLLSSNSELLDLVI